MDDNDITLALLQVALRAEVLPQRSMFATGAVLTGGCQGCLIVSTLMPQARVQKKVCCGSWMVLVLSPILTQALGM
jgi:hypothetical protein